MRATRRTFRTAAIATGAIAALAVPTTAAFADAPSTPQPQVANPDPAPNPDDEVTPPPTPDDEVTPPPTPDDEVTPTPNPDDKTEPDKPVGGWESKGTVPLGDGWSAKVDVNASARSAKAQIFLKGAAKGSLEAYIKPASTRIDGCTFTLSADGGITKTGRPTPPKPQPKPKPQPAKKRVFVREYKNLGKSGFDAKVYKTKAGYEADMIAKSPGGGKKIVWDTLKQRGNKAAYGQHNGAHFVLNPDGTMKGWVERGSGKPGHVSTVVPRGGVKAGAENVAPPSHDAPLVAAGGGMAALGAAGMGFSMYRRKQS
ncbi:hypothetical protein ABT390_12380 [Streptomyces aurantiacus]|uniref:Gram-positive cocci surface proteins LPxTG domain-containing protein n=1 Tax=Streptomyces aurantiacus JA 4570 TaxID=1286094 RepID=S3ZBX4_9ACTN|nr:hypothetical protein [Streptomyces aurantiacus]EPH40099.1 hypothetical protein STRAU_6836 [Streptomyces aurantiacus JA 4570]